MTAVMTLNLETRLSKDEIAEGDRVTMKIHAHDYRKSGGMLTGTVTKYMDDRDLEMLAEGRRPLADVTVEADNGTVWTWNVDNGYVIGPVDAPDRPSRSDIGRIAGFYDPDAREETDREIDAAEATAPFGF